LVSMLALLSELGGANHALLFAAVGAVNLLKIRVRLPT